jgi:hypothetical protein
MPTLDIRQFAKEAHHDKQDHIGGYLVGLSN